jgi:hypothetical protein
MLLSQRVLHGTSDISVAVNDFRSAAQVFAYEADEYLFIGSEVPFNNLWFDVAVPNDQASVISVDLWWGQSWAAAVDVIDMTAVGGNSLAQSGRIVWRIEDGKGWQDEPRSEQVTGLEQTKIYDFYWTRIKFSASLKATTAIKYIGQRFNTDDELYSYYPDMQQSGMKTAIKAGKADWAEQSYMAAEAVIRDLVARNVIDSAGQIFDWSLFNEASCHKLAEIVYGALGTAYAEAKKSAAESYGKAMNRRLFRVDTDKSGELTPRKAASSAHFMRR